MEGHTLEEDFCAGEKGASAVSDSQLCSFCTGYGILPRNINLSVIKTETIILCIDRVPISQETRALLEILYNQCPQHPFQRWRFVSFLNISHLTLFPSFSHSVALLTYFLTVFSAFLQTLPFYFIHVWEHTCMHKCVCVCVCVCVCMCVCVRKRYAYVLRAT